MVITNLPDGEVSALKVSATLDGKPAMQDMDITSPLNRFGVRLPPGTRGQLVLLIDALTADRCKIATGQLTVPVGDPFRFDLETQLMVFPSKQCTTNLPCSPDTFCWFNPLPQGNTLWGIWTVTPSDVWAVGVNGTTVHYDGTAWKSIRTENSFTLYSAWGPKGVANDIWAVGTKGRIMHYDGTTWSIRQSPTDKELFSIWGSAADDIWAVGDDRVSAGVIVHYDGTKWSNVPNSFPPLNGVWVNSRTQGAACGVSGRFIRLNNSTTWTAMTSTATRTMLSIFGTNFQEVYAVGAGGSISSYDQNSDRFIAENSGTAVDLYGVSGLPGGLSLSGPYFAVGDGGTLLRATSYGQPWGALSTNGTTLSLHNIQVVKPPGGVASGWLVGDGGALLRLDASLMVATPSNPPYTHLRGVFGSSTTDVWSVGEGGFSYRYSGSPGWTKVTNPAVPPLNATWSSGPNDTWAVGDGKTVIRWNGISWSAVVVSSHEVDALRAIWGSKSTDVWMVGSSPTSGGSILRYDGTNLILHSKVTGTAGLNGVWGSGPGDIWFVGDQKIFHGDGTAAAPTATQVSGTLRAVWGSGPSDVWAVGDSGLIMRYNGTSWSTVASGLTTQNILAIWGSGAQDVWAVGSAGLLLRFDGKSWGINSSGTSNRLTSVWGVGLNDVWVVGDFGTTLRTQK